MSVQKIVDMSIKIVDLASYPDPIKCISLINDLAPEEDPISELVYRLSKNELSSAMKIIENFEYEGDARGALNRILSHLESASTLARDYYYKKVQSDSTVNYLVPWFMSEKAQTVHEDIVKMCFYQLVCHKLLNSSVKRLYQILSEVPFYTDYKFGNYTEAISRLFDEELWEAIICNRKHEFAFIMCSKADLIDSLPYLFPGSSLINSTCLAKLHNFIETKLDSELASLIIENKLDYWGWNMDEYFPRYYIPF